MGGVTAQPVKRKWLCFIINTRRPEIRKKKIVEEDGKNKPS